MLAVGTVGGAEAGPWPYHRRMTSSWASNEQTRRSMQSNRSSDTAPELAIRRLLHARGLRYVVNARPERDIRRTADLVFRGSRIAVFVDGCFWHGCPKHYREPKSHVDYWRPKIGRNMSRDMETTAQLEEAGWIVLRFWSHELSASVAESVAAQVMAAKEDGVQRDMAKTGSAT
jgi:DNA mismatch endonuclease, patch repair protein